MPVFRFLSYLNPDRSNLIWEFLISVAGFGCAPAMALTPTLLAKNSHEFHQSPGSGQVGG